MIKNIIGKKYGRLTVKELVGTNEKKDALWLCECSCGNSVIAQTKSLTTGDKKSCGCLYKESRKNTGKANKRYNKYFISGDVCVGITQKGEEFRFDEEDYEKVKKFCWYINKLGYVATANGKLFHRVIMDCPKKMVIDHINHDKTDNRKNNLRICTSSQNFINSKMINKDNIKGVNKYKYGWVAELRSNGVRHRKCFKQKDDAIAKRKEWERIYQGEFAYDPNNDVRTVKK